MKPTENTSLELNIRGMDCADCVRTVETALNGLPGVTSAQVFLTAERGKVTYDPTAVAPQAIVNAVNATGYTAEVREANEPTSQPTNPPTNRWLPWLPVFFLAGLSLFALIELILEGMQGTAILPRPLALLATLGGGWPIARRALGGLRQRQITADLLMSMAILAALALGEFVAAMLIVFFMRVAHALESFTTTRARHAIKALVRLAPEVARVQRAGLEVEIPARELRVGDRLLVRPGERIAADGEVLDGYSAVDQAPITGESMPIEKRAGDAVFAGTLNQRGALTVNVTRVGPETLLGRIAKTVEEAEASKAPVQKFADRYSTLFLPIILIVAAITSVIAGNLQTGIAVLVVACPCAVALATPLAVTASVGAAARRGILIKGGLYLEALARADVLVMDKTGTLTLGKPMVTDVIADFGLRIAESEIANRKSEILQLAASAEKRSEHPLAEAILREARRLGVHAPEPESFEMTVGGGVSARVNGHTILLGSRRWLNEQGVAFGETADRATAQFEREGKTVMGVASVRGDSRRRLSPSASSAVSASRDASYTLMGLIAVADTLRDEVPAALDQLRRLGIKRMVLLSGDNRQTVEAIGKGLGIEAHGAMLPEDKIAFVRELQAQGHIVAMVGDGINDAPALAQADVGIAMGAAGTDLAIEAADIALMRDDWMALPLAVKIARRTFGTIRQNIGFGVLFNIAGVTLAAIGILTPILAAAAQSLPDVAVFLNSSKLLRVK
ncbi:MAG TPA: cation-translocating P-type ATPase [Anaerolineae bacterium]|nr:cation-translocating P-type ATPase [Anaerolineae bacterium]